MSEAPPVQPAGGDAYFEHDADVGVIGRGATVEEAFEDAARATFAIMADPASLMAEEAVTVEFEEADLEIALVRWLNALIAAAREHGLALARFWVERDGVRWRGGARGEPWRRGADRGVEVKGATLTMLSVKQTDTGWEARCVVDV
ncbi:MAG: archease [Burkholderiales bacterium]|nr:archease [Burkholderiales bacterium]